MTLSSSGFGTQIVQRVTPLDRAHFFGYFDRCPWDSSNRYLLTLRVPDSLKPPGTNDRASIALVDSEGDEPLREVAQSSAWNYQQGAMQQWLTGGDEQSFIHNDRRGEHFVAVVRDLSHRELTILPKPVYHVSSDGRWALTLNFSRLARTRPGYGYAGPADTTDGELSPRNDGIWRIELKSGLEELILPLAQVAGYEPVRGMYGAEHWCNHLIFNPSGTRFAFVHRWRSPDRSGLHQKLTSRQPRSRLATKLRRFLGATYRSVTGRRFSGHQSRLFSASADGTDLRCLASGGMVSHYSWRDDHHLIAWSRRDPVGDRYWLIDDRDGSAAVIGDTQLTRDGHCTYSPDRRWVLTDTYPNAEGDQELVLYDVKAQRRVSVGHFPASRHLAGETRCDLHPRFDRFGMRVCFDSAHEGIRQLYVADVSKWTGRA